MGCSLFAWHDFVFGLVTWFLFVLLFICCVLVFGVLVFWLLCAWVLVLLRGWVVVDCVG